MTTDKPTDRAKEVSTIRKDPCEVFQCQNEICGGTGCFVLANDTKIPKSKCLCKRILKPTWVWIKHSDGEVV
jgi:hypothetical protein